jgi:lipopolysaccharide export system permease protein
MRLLNRYISKQVFLSISLVLLIFIGVYTVFSFVGEMRNFNKNYGFLASILNVLYSIPQNLIFMLPVASLLGTLIALGNLASHSELTAMRAGGFSILRIAFSVLRIGAIIALISFFFAAFIGPYVGKQALLSNFGGGRRASILFTPQATWLKEGSDFVYVTQSKGVDYLEGLVRYHLEDGNLTSITWANTAIYKEGSWHLSGLREVDISTTGVTQRESKTATWSELVPPSLLKAVSSRVSNLNLIELYRYLKYRHLNGLDARSYELKIWQLYAQPFSILILMLIAVPFSFGQLRSSSLGVRLVIGVVIGVAYFLLDRFFGPAVLVMNLPIFLGAFLPSFIFLGLCGLFFWRFL